MSRAYVLINAEIGKEDIVAKALSEVPYVTHVATLYGAYDVGAWVTTPNMDIIKEVVTWKIRCLDGARSTQTMIENKRYEPKNPQIGSPQIESTSRAARVFINSESGYEDKAAEAVCLLPHVREVSSVFGVFDVIAYLVAPDMDILKGVIGQKLRRVDKIRSTQTMIESEKYRSHNLQTEGPNVLKS